MPRFRFVLYVFLGGTREFKDVNMIPEILFLALVGAAFVQGGPARFPQINIPFKNDEEVSTERVAETHGHSEGDKQIVTYDDWTDVGNEEIVNENLEDYANESENGNDNFNDQHEFPIVYDRPEDNKDVAATINVEGANDNANVTHIHDHVPTIVTENISHADPVTEHQTRKSDIGDLFDIFGQAIHDVVNENARNFNNGVRSFLKVGKTVFDAVTTIINAKIKFAYSFPRIRTKFFDAWEKN